MIYKDCTKDGRLRAALAEVGSAIYVQTHVSRQAEGLKLGENGHWRWTWQSSACLNQWTQICRECSLILSYFIQSHSCSCNRHRCNENDVILAEAREMPDRTSPLRSTFQLLIWTLCTGRKQNTHGFFSMNIDTEKKKQKGLLPALKSRIVCTYSCFPRKTWRRAFHRGNLLLALASCIASNNIADVRGCLKTAHVLHHLSMSWHSRAKLRFNDTWQSYIAKLHGKATRQNYLAKYLARLLGTAT